MSVLDPQRMLDALGRVHEHFVADRDDTARLEVVETALRAGLELTESALSFIASIRSGPSGPVLVLETVLAADPKRYRKVIAWLEETLANGASGGTIPTPLAKLARATEPMILDYEPRLPALDNFLAIPISRHGKRWQPTAVFALADRSGGFTAEIAEALEPLLGACATVFKAYEDAAERAVREAEFERSEQRFRTFMDASPCIAYITDKDRQVVWASRAFGQQFGVSPQEAIGRHEDELLPGGMAARTREISEQARVADGVVDMLEPIVDSSGVIHWWQGAKFPIDGDAGERLVGSLALDVSDNVRMTQVLREREAALAEAQELARIARWTWVIETDQLSWDAQFERLSGLPSRDGLHLDDLFAFLHPDDIEPTRRALQHLRENLDTRLTLEHRLLVQGQVVDLFVVLLVRDELEDGPTILAVTQDVSYRRKLERTRRGLEHQARRYESLSVLSSAMAHEFNGLLFGILGNAGIALDDLEHESLAAACVQDIESAAERAAALTEQMLAFSSGGRVVREPLELSSLVTSLDRGLHDAVSTNVSIRLALHPDLPMIEGDLNQLRQLLTNLVVNSSEAIGEADGQITIETGVEPFELEQLGEFAAAPPGGAGTYAWLQVRDTGAGMDAATRERIFQPFFSTNQAGRGLGLAAVLGIVRTHRGGIRVRSSPANGTTVTVVFPPTTGSAIGEDRDSWSHTVS